MMLIKLSSNLILSLFLKVSVFSLCSTHTSTVQRAEDLYIKADREI